MNVLIAIPMGLGVVAGVALGAVPVVNEHLHWVLWYVVPITAIVFGVAVGWAQFRVAYLLNVRVARAAILALVFACTVGYVGTDFGIYLTTSVPVEGVEGVDDGDYALRGIMSFQEYMGSRLESTTMSSLKHPEDTTDYGSTGTKVLYFIDVLGAFLGSLGILLLMAGESTFCERCGTYRRSVAKLDIPLAGGDSEIEAAVERLHSLANEARYSDVAAHLKTLSTDKTSPIKVVAEERQCRDCGDLSLIAKVERVEGNQWKPVKGLRYELESKTMERGRLRSSERSGPHV